VSKKCGHGEADYLVFVDGVAVESSKTRAGRYDADELPLGSGRGLRFARKDLLACFGNGLDAGKETSDRSLRHFLI
jgi:hypothetical protein